MLTRHLRIRRFFRGESGALTKDWIVIGAALVGLIGSTVYTIRTSDTAQVRGNSGFMASSIGDIGCTISGALGNACVPIAQEVISEHRWENWCSQPNGPRCSFREQAVTMSDGAVWKVIEITAPSGARQVVWRDHLGRTVDPPRVG